MSEIEWTNDSVIRLLQEYKKYAVLWDTRHELYRVQTAKYEAYTELAAMFDCDIVDLRKKLNSVFASYRREKAKVRHGTRSTWFLYPYMKFLPNYVASHSFESKPKPKRRSPSPFYTEEEHLIDDTIDDESSSNYQEDIIIKEEIPTSVVTSTVRKNKFRHSKPRLTKTVTRPVIKQVTSTNQLDSRLLEALKLLRRSNISRKKDECDSFGEYIAVSLRKHDDRTQSMIKQAINNILFEQEMKKHNAPQYVVIANVSENPLTLNDHDGSDK